MLITNKSKKHTIQKKKKFVLNISLLLCFSWLILVFLCFLNFLFFLLSFSCILKEVGSSHI